MDNSRWVIMQDAIGATGNGNIIDVAGLASLGLQVSGTFVGTVTFEATVDDTNWVALQVAAVNTGAISTTATAPGLFWAAVAALSKVRARVSAWTSGAITIVGQASVVGAGATLADVDIAAAETMSIDQTTDSTTNAVRDLNAESRIQPNSTQADQRLTVDATVGGVQFSAFHADTLYVFWSNEDAQCRVTFDASAPTTTNGHIINIGDSGVWSKALATAAKFIRTGGTSAVIHASQMK